MGGHDQAVTGLNVAGSVAVGLGGRRGRAGEEGEREQEQGGSRGCRAGSSHELPSSSSFFSSSAEGSSSMAFSPK